MISALENLVKLQQVCWMIFIQLLLFFAFGSLFIFLGVENGYLIGIFTFVCVYGVTVVIPGIIGKLRNRQLR